MVKRAWSEISDSPRDSRISPVPAHQRKRSSPSHNEADKDILQASLPQISRKVKACAACRKQKIKCIMDDHGPPCRRCTERNLGCVLNKSLQTIIDEKSQYADAYGHDLEMIHHTLQDVLRKVGMAPIPPLQSSQNPTNARPETTTGTAEEQDSSPPVIQVTGPRQSPGPSRDTSPRLNPADVSGGLSDVPIQSLYALTKLSALRSPDVGEGEGRGKRHSVAGRTSDGPNDFISRNLITRTQALRLFTLYRDRLDHFMYRIGCPYSTLDEVRQKSSILTAAICTVAALHSPSSDKGVGGDEIYGVCSEEFRRLMGEAMFERLVKRDDLRGMAIAAYWLSDVSWTISGYAIRRAGDVGLSCAFKRVMAREKEGGLGAEGKSDADCLRLWYILYICDHHLAILYGRQPIVHDDFSIRGCERFTETENDVRLVSQVSLLLIFGEMRNLFGHGGSERPLGEEYLDLIGNLERQLDLWFDTWTARMKESYTQLGAFPPRFPRFGALMHLHFAKLHLYSHVFQGDRQSKTPAIPLPFIPYANAAVASATAIISLLLNEPIVQQGLVGMPSYLHSMTAFACMFLIKVAMKYGHPLVEQQEVEDLIRRLVALFRRTETGTWHLVHLMEGGLEKMLSILSRVQEKKEDDVLQEEVSPQGGGDGGGGASGFTFGTLMGGGAGGQEAGAWSDWAGDLTVPNLDGHNFMDYNIGLGPLLRFDTSTPGFGSAMGGF